MKKDLYVVFDRVAAEICSPVFTANNDDVAKRSFFLMIDQNKQFPNPQDYELLSIGDLDFSTGAISGLNAPIKICDGASFYSVNNQEVK